MDVLFLNVWLLYGRCQFLKSNFSLATSELTNFYCVEKIIVHHGSYNVESLVSSKQRVCTSIVLEFDLLIQSLTIRNCAKKIENRVKISCKEQLEIIRK